MGHRKVFILFVLAASLFAVNALAQENLPPQEPSNQNPRTFQTQSARQETTFPLQKQSDKKEGLMERKPETRPASNSSQLKTRPQEPIQGKEQMGQRELMGQQGKQPQPERMGASGEAKLMMRQASPSAKFEERLFMKRQEFQASLQEKREEMKEEIQERRAEFKEKLETIKDEKKQEIVEKIDTKFTTINQNRTTMMIAGLEKLSNVVAKLSNRIETAKAAGQDTTAAEAALSEAQTLLETSQQAVAEQAAQDYTPTITDETQLKSTVGATASQLQSDLQAVHKTVVAAKQALEKALAEVKKLSTVKVTPTPTL